MPPVILVGGLWEHHTESYGEARICLLSSSTKDGLREGLVITHALDRCGLAAPADTRHKAGLKTHRSVPIAFLGNV